MEPRAVSLTATQSTAVREVTEVWPGRKIVIIGATALGFYFDMRWRKTSDVDCGRRNRTGCQED